jgi:hypothetical protein
MEISKAQNSISSRPETKTIKKIPTPSEKGKKKSSDEGNYFATLDPPVSIDMINRSWVRVKPLVTGSRAVQDWEANRDSTSIERRMLSVTAVHIPRDFAFCLKALLVERYYGERLRKILFDTPSGAALRIQFSKLLTGSTGVDVEGNSRPYRFWDHVDIHDKGVDGLHLLTDEERKHMVDIDALYKSNMAFNQKVINLVEKSKESHILFDSKSEMDGGIHRALDNLIWVTLLVLFA